MKCLSNCDIILNKLTINRIFGFKSFKHSHPHNTAIKPGEKTDTVPPSNNSRGLINNNRTNLRNISRLHRVFLGRILVATDLHRCQRAERRVRIVDDVRRLVELVEFLDVRWWRALQQEVLLRPRRPQQVRHHTVSEAVRRIRYTLVWQTLSVINYTQFCKTYREVAWTSTGRRREGQ